MSGLLLDTCAFLYLARREPIRRSAERLIEDAIRADALYVSTVTAWEIGLLARPERPWPAEFDPDPQSFFDDALSQPGVHLAELTAEIALGSSLLLPRAHPDPADRMLIKTALTLGVPIVTRDRPIYLYAQRSDLQVVLC